MTPQEQQMIDGLVDRIRNTPVENKDRDAEQHIQQALGSYPDALYVLVQTVLVQQYGLQQAQSQLNELKQTNESLQARLSDTASQSRSSSGSFLSHIFGSSHQDEPPAQNQYQPVRNPGYPPASYPPSAPPPPYPQQGYPTQAYPPAGGGVFGGGGGGGFLQGALQTAAGVAAGEMMFQGMEDLFHGFGHGGGDRGFASPGGETVVNNYYDDNRDRDTGNRDDSSFYNPDHDASRSDGAFGSSSGDIQGSSDAGQFAGDSMNFAGGDSDSNDISYDNSSNDLSFDNGGNDSSSFDDSSSDFSGDNS